MLGDRLSHDFVWTKKSDKIMDGKMGSIRDMHLGGQQDQEVNTTGR